MSQKILCITGWGVGIELLKPLQAELQRKQLEVDLINIFALTQDDFCQQYITMARHYDVLMGWSLGGQLASYLAQQLWQRTGQVKALITLASNPCFVQQDDWPKAMPQDDFFAFKQSYTAQAATCIKRFCYLMVQGSQQSKQDWIYLQSLLVPQDEQLQQQGLNTLEHLTTMKILQNYPGPQYHLLGLQDHLVDHQISQDMPYLAAKFIKIKGTHAFPVLDVTQTSEKIVQICQQLTSEA